MVTSLKLIRLPKLLVIVGTTASTIQKLLLELVLLKDTICDTTGLLAFVFLGLMREAPIHD